MSASIVCHSCGSAKKHPAPAAPVKKIITKKAIIRAAAQKANQLTQALVEKEELSRLLGRL
jgi:hypothetical protein